MRNFCHPFVPMFVHQVIDQPSGGFGEIGIDILGSAAIFYCGNHNHFLAVGRNLESADAVFKVADHMAG